MAVQDTQDSVFSVHVMLYILSIYNFACDRIKKEVSRYVGLVKFGSVLMWWGGHWTPFNILGVLMTTLTPLKLRRNEFGMDCSCFMGKSLGLSRQNFSSCLGHSNQIYLVTFMCLTVDTSFIFTKKNQNLWNVFLISLMLR